MTIVPLYGHDDVRTRLVGALASGRLPQALLFVGPDGVGKQRLALWLGQALVCESIASDSPCGECRGCWQAVRLQHPDVQWFVPFPRAPGTDANNEVERAASALAEIMAERREDLYTKPGGLAGHRIGSVRLLLRQLAMKPVFAKRNVFIIGDAERLVPQESSPEAANALLKSLEEPPPHTTFILTTSTPQALLSTIRSRLVTVRIPRVADEVVAEFMTTELRPPVTKAQSRKRAPMADGCIGAVLRDEAQTTRSVERLLGALRSVEARSAASLGQPPWSARGDFTELLDGLAWSLRNKTRRALEKGNDVRRHVLALEAVAETRGLARGNVNPQLLLADLMEKLAEA